MLHINDSWQTQPTIHYESEIELFSVPVCQISFLFLFLPNRIYYCVLLLLTVTHSGMEHLVLSPPLCTSMEWTKGHRQPYTPANIQVAYTSKGTVANTDRRAHVHTGKALAHKHRQHGCWDDLCTLLFPPISGTSDADATSKHVPEVLLLLFRFRLYCFAYPMIFLSFCFPQQLTNTAFITLSLGSICWISELKLEIRQETQWYI